MLLLSVAYAIVFGSIEGNPDAWVAVVNDVTQTCVIVRYIEVGYYVQDGYYVLD